MSNRTWRQFLSPALFSLTLLLSGCLKQAPPPHYYTLSTPGYEGVPEKSYPNPVLVGPVRVSSALDRGLLLMQKTDHSISASESHRWAGELPEMISDALVSNLSQQLGNSMVHTFPTNRELSGFQVELYFLHFQGDGSQHALVTTRWTIVASDTLEILHSETSSHRIKLESGEYKDLAGGLSEGLTLLSGDIAAKLLTMRPVAAN